MQYLVSMIGEDGGGWVCSVEKVLLLKKKEVDSGPMIGEGGSGLWPVAGERGGGLWLVTESEEVGSCPL